MAMEDFRDEVGDEIAALISSGMTVEVRTTNTVPHSNDPAITFPNLDTLTLKCKMIETAVLFIDVRRSTELSLEHKPHTVSKLYSAFVRSMTRCARYFGGHVRGIAGDRVMVLFDVDDAATNAVKTAQLMNSVIQFQLDDLFKTNDIKCGIGIDFGRMLVTKTGIRKNGHENNNYKSLVWLGRPANVASKLTDISNKTTSITEAMVAEGFSHPTQSLTWGPDMTYEQFLDRLKPNYLNNHLAHVDPEFRCVIKRPKFKTIVAPPILMTEPVYRRFKSENPTADSVTKGWYSKRPGLSVPGYSGTIYGGDVYFTAFKE